MQIHFGGRCLAVDAERQKLHIRDAPTPTVRTVAAGPVVGADASARSSARACGAATASTTARRTCTGLKEILLPAALRRPGIARQDVLHVCRRDPCLLLDFPNRDDSLALSLHMPFDDGASFASVESESGLAALFAERFREIGPLQSATTRQSLSARANSMVTLRRRPGARTAGRRSSATRPTRWCPLRTGRDDGPRGRLGTGRLPRRARS